MEPILDSYTSNIFEFGILGLFNLALIITIIFLVRFILRLLKEFKVVINTFNTTINEYIKAQERNTAIVDDVKKMVSRILDK